MTLDNKIIISLATSSDREKIYKIRHRVFASELKQHVENVQEIITDKLDNFNTYITAKINLEIIGFISITPPDGNIYSIDKYIKRTELPFTVDKGLYEMRILTVLKEHRNSPVALLLMWAALRWIDAHKGSNIMAIGRIEILDLYLKLGFHAMNHTIKSGSVTFELLFGNVNKLNDYIINNYKPLFSKLIKNCIWDLNISLIRPTECYHGGDFFQAIGTEFDDLNRKNKIINADVLDAWFPPSPKILKELESNLSWICRTSPPTDCIGMTNIIARTRGVQPENILPGAGSSDLIFLAFREWLTSLSRVLILDPSYGEYPHVLENIIGCQVDRLEILKDQGYVLNLEKLITLSKGDYDLIVLVNPNSPTGQHIERKDFEAVIDLIPNNTRVWIDETYIEYAGSGQSLEQYAAKRSNVIVCKSMSKVYALSGLRSAYLCASPYQLETLRSITPPWAVSLPSQIAAVIALQDDKYYLQCYQQTHILREELFQELSKLNNLQPVRTITNFFLCNLTSNGPNAKTVVQKCQEKGLYIRNASNMGTHIGDYTIRIAVKDRETNKQMVSILKEVLFV